LSSELLYRMFAGRVIWWMFTRLSRCGWSTAVRRVWQQFSRA